MHLILNNNLEELPRLAEELENFGVKNKLTTKLILALNLALEEAFSNIILHNYQSCDQDKKVEIQCSIANSKLTISIKDEGQPFDPLSMKEVDTSQSLKQRQIGGLGIHIIRQIMDQVEYRRENNQNILTLTKIIA